ncbi:Acyl-CoA desaturase [Penicillium angulare]|uniref:Acyl-CoA desaturase n=1 Tax=Penicillium angulare TaxID=116970 RepID=UPI002540E849|nr:Acyl-CoA desaturase [Penicillium angulare]KAJ5279303.1 Acyl-CoA desaturase [Penicillium angulare]
MASRIRELHNAKLSSINWPIATFLIVIPLAAITSLLWVPIIQNTVYFMLIYIIIRGMSITAGYHRLWSHRTYTASTPLKVILAILGAGAGQGSIKFWCRGHRAHHRYVDTDQDPYNIQKGFFYAHLGWMLVKDKRSLGKISIAGRVDISDLKHDPIVQWQHRYYLPLLFIMGYALPTFICGILFDDPVGGFVLGGCIGTGIGQQGTFCVNSFAHWIGSQPYASTKSPRNNFLTALITFGEGYHNFHHEFPIDYRNGIRYYDFDPTKWLIWTCSQIGLATNLRRFPQNEIKKGRIQREQEKINQKSKIVDWGVPLSDLPVITWEEYQQQARTGCNLIVIKGVAHEVSAFVTEHPGGATLITGAVGRDATDMFEGGVYEHSNAASNLLASMRVAIIGDDMS